MLRSGRFALGRFSISPTGLFLSPQKPFRLLYRVIKPTVFALILVMANHDDRLADNVSCRADSQYKRHGHLGTPVR